MSIMFREEGHLRYLIGFIAVIGLLFIIILLIVHHHSGPSTTKQQKTLTSYINDPNATVSETVVGPVSASQTHQQYQISVSNQTATMNVMAGYDGSVTSSKTYPMTTASFSELINALNRAGFTEGNTSSTLSNDQGYCPTGERYIFELQDGSSKVQRFWSTSCGGTKTYRGNTDLTTSLFEAQIPDFNDLVNNTDFQPLLNL